MTSAHARPSSLIASAPDPGSGPSRSHHRSPWRGNGVVPCGLLDRYRAGATVTALAQRFGVSLDWVAQRLEELDSEEWLGVQLARGAGLGDLGRRLLVTPSGGRYATGCAATRDGAWNGPPRPGPVLVYPARSSASRPQPTLTGRLPALLGPGQLAAVSVANATGHPERRTLGHDEPARTGR